MDILLSMVTMWVVVLLITVIAVCIAERGGE